MAYYYKFKLTAVLDRKKGGIMNKLKKFYPCILIFIILLGASGCMKKSENYQEDILSYLEAKYNEKFVVDSMKKEIGMGTTDNIRAKVHSDIFPEIKFTVNYNLAFSDVHNKEEVVELLKQTDAYDEKYLKEWEDDVEPYFEDDYANILYQNKFNNSLEEKLDIKTDYLIQTRFDTPNYFTSLKESQVDLESYLGTENYDLYAYHFLFIKDEGDTIESKLNLINEVTKALSNPKITEQYLLVYFLNDFSPNEIKNKYYENYEFPNDYFANMETCTASAIVTMENGVVIDSNQDIMNMLGE